MDIFQCSCFQFYFHGKLPVSFREHSIIEIPIVVATFLLISTTGNPYVLILGIAFSGFNLAVFSEFNQRETGMDMIKEYLRYLREGEIEYERSCLNVPASKRCVRNKINEENGD